MTEFPKRRVTAADIARSLGISRATVGFVLNNTPGQTISEHTRQRVLQEASRLGYRPHTAAQALASGKSKLILLILPDWPLEHTMRQHIEEMRHVLDDAGYSLVTHTSVENSKARPLWETLNPDVVLGMGPFREGDVGSMRQAGIEHIFPDPDASTLSEDNPVLGAGPRLQVEHLHQLGHRKLAFAGTTDPRLRALQDARWQAAVQQALQLGLPELEFATFSSPSLTTQNTIKQWALRGVTGVVAYNDDLAALVVSSALRCGLQVPGDLSVMGHDNAPLCELVFPSISSVDINPVGFGRYLSGMALHLAGQQRHAPEIPQTQATLLERESVARLVRPPG